MIRARLQAAGKPDVWIAASEFATKTDDRLTVALEMPMTNFVMAGMFSVAPSLQGAGVGKAVLVP